MVVASTKDLSTKYKLLSTTNIKNASQRCVEKHFFIITNQVHYRLAKTIMWID